VNPRAPLVLVVDDDQVSRLVLAHMLTRLGCMVIEADDVAAASELDSVPGLDLVISDFAMPGGTGLDLLTHLRRQHQRVPFVIMTGLVEHADLADVDASLTKPVSTRALIDCLRRLWPTWSPP